MRKHCWTEQISLLLHPPAEAAATCKFFHLRLSDGYVHSVKSKFFLLKSSTFFNVANFKITGKNVENDFFLCKITVKKWVLLREFFCLCYIHVIFFLLLRLIIIHGLLDGHITFWFLMSSISRLRVLFLSVSPLSEAKILTYILRTT